MTRALFLPGVPEDYVRDRLQKAGGDELGSGKFASPDSSAALAANAFGWFVPRPERLPPLPGMEEVGRVGRVELEYCARFPWVGGRHPWLDAAVFTNTHLVGIESKRFEPFRDVKVASFSSAYWRPVWGDRMDSYGAVRDALVSKTLRYQHLDAAQLIKHAYGLVTEARRLSLKPCLFYIYAEPAAHAGAAITAEDHQRHRSEIVDFRDRVSGDEVAFGAASYCEWLATVEDGVAEHKNALVCRFEL